MIFESKLGTKAEVHNDVCEYYHYKELGEGMGHSGCELDGNNCPWYYPTHFTSCGRYFFELHETTIMEEIYGLAHNAISYGPTKFEEVVVSPKLFDSLRIECESKYKLMSAPVGFQEFYLNNMKIVVSKFLPDDEIIFQSKTTGEFSRMKLGMIKNINKVDPPLPQDKEPEFRLIRLGDES